MPGGSAVVWDTALQRLQIRGMLNYLDFGQERKNGRFGPAGQRSPFDHPVKICREIHYVDWYGGPDKNYTASRQQVESGAPGEI